MRIYTDSHNEDNDEILRRTSEQLWELLDRFSRNDKQKLSKVLGIIDNYCSMKVSEVSQLEEFSTQYHVALSSEIIRICEEERELLRLENILARKNAFRIMFSNDFKGDSPFDIIHDLHDIDEILYGEKYTEQKPPEPSFATFNEEQTFYLLEGEFWQDQTSDNIDNELGGVLSQKDYGSYPPSIVGNIAGMDVPLGQLSSISTVGGETTHQAYRNTHGDFATGGIATGADPHSSEISVDKSAPEVSTISDVRIFNTFEALIDRLLEESSSAAMVLNSGKQNSGLDMESIQEKEKERRHLFWNELLRHEEESEFLANDEHFGLGGTSRIDITLEFWNKNLEAFLGVPKEIKGPPAPGKTSGARGMHKLLSDFVQYHIQK